ANPALTFTTSGFVNGDTVATALTGQLLTSAALNSAPGSYAITQGTLASSNYAITFQGGTLAVTPAGTAVDVTTNFFTVDVIPEGAILPTFRDTQATLTVVVSPVAPGAGVPTGVVTFRDGDTLLGQGTLALVDGHAQASFTPSLSPNGHIISATYAGDGNF